jgi:hypothetical protein
MRAFSVCCKSYEMTREAAGYYYVHITLCWPRVTLSEAAMCMCSHEKSEESGRESENCCCGLKSVERAVKCNILMFLNARELPLLNNIKVLKHFPNVPARSAADKR